MEIDLNEPTRPQIAALLGCTSRWIGELRANGEMPADGATMQENVEAWVARHMPKFGDDGSEKLDKEQEQARLAKEQAAFQAMDNAERRKELASLSNMTGAVIGVIALAVTRLSQVRSLVVKGDNKLREWVELAINDALEERSVTLDHPSAARLVPSPVGQPQRQWSVGGEPLRRCRCLPRRAREHQLHWSIEVSR